MPERSHLSIGEVLSLLRDEFPDVTISKIRFLESQGLVDPERTPSGYRKFYDHDVERLRWILRQQREHFLPLKVIRGRLTEQGESLHASVGSQTAGAQEVFGGTARPSGPAPPPPGPGRDAGGGAAAEGLRPSRERTDAVAPGPPVQDAVSEAHEPPRPASGVSSPRLGGPTAESGNAEPPTVAPIAPAARPSLPTPSLFAELHSARAGRYPGPPPPPPPLRESSTLGAGLPAPRPEPVPARKETATASGPEAGDSDTFSADELAAAAGGTTRLVSELEQFGLISTHTVVAGTPYFDARALAVAKAAAELSRHGVEVRHMRIWRNAADRETDLFQQIVLPLLRQRNPQSRRQATETLGELTRLGGELRRALVERAVSDIR